MMKRYHSILLLSGLTALFLIFSCKKTKIEGSLPSLEYFYVSSTTDDSVYCTGNISIDGGLFILERGVCWALSPEPALDDNKIVIGKGVGMINASIARNVSSNTIYIRSYAINQLGTGYSNEISVTGKSSSSQNSSSVSVITAAISDITETTAISGGNITSDGSYTISDRGVCWNTTGSPTINDHTTNDGNSEGSYTSDITGLTAGTTYYVRAYVSYSNNTLYGNEISFITASSSLGDLPTLTTKSISDIKATTANSGGNITSDGGYSITEFGVCWNTSGNPTLNDNYTIDGNGIDSYISNITGLSAGITYYVRAYATNSNGTGYGQQESFTTRNTENTISDIDGNIYDTITIGTQTWMKENLKVTKYNDGTEIPLITDYTTWYQSTTPGYCWCKNNETSYKDIYGALYNFYTIENGNVCPTGWHVPTDDEWTILTDFLGGLSVAGGKLKETGTAHWNSPNTGATDELGFTALPAGNRGFNGTFYDLQNYGYWWSSSVTSSSSSYYRRIYYASSTIKRDFTPKYIGASIRCIKD